jgi:hypothetical protein
MPLDGSHEAAAQLPDARAVAQPFQQDEVNPRSRHEATGKDATPANSTKTSVQVAVLTAVDGADDSAIDGVHVAVVFVGIVAACSSTCREWCSTVTDPSALSKAGTSTPSGPLKPTGFGG